MAQLLLGAGASMHKPHRQSSCELAPQAPPSLPAPPHLATSMSHQAQAQMSSDDKGSWNWHLPALCIVKSIRLCACVIESINGRLLVPTDDRVPSSISRMQPLSMLCYEHIEDIYLLELGPVLVLTRFSKTCRRSIDKFIVASSIGRTSQCAE